MVRTKSTVSAGSASVSCSMRKVISFVVSPSANVFVPPMRVTSDVAPETVRLISAAPAPELRVTVTPKLPSTSDTV